MVEESPVGQVVSCKACGAAITSLSGQCPQCSKPFDSNTVLELTTALVIQGVERERILDQLRDVLSGVPSVSPAARAMYGRSGAAGRRAALLVLQASGDAASMAPTLLGMSYLRGTPALRVEIIKTLMAGGGQDAVAVLERIRESEKDPEVRAAFGQRAEDGVEQEVTFPALEVEGKPAARPRPALARDEKPTVVAPPPDAASGDGGEGDLRDEKATVVAPPPTEALERSSSPDRSDEEDVDPLAPFEPRPSASGPISVPPPSLILDDESRDSSLSIEELLETIPPGTDLEPALDLDADPLPQPPAPPVAEPAPQPTAAPVAEAPPPPQPTAAPVAEAPPPPVAKAPRRRKGPRLGILFVVGGLIGGLGGAAVTVAALWWIGAFGAIVPEADDRVAERGGAGERPPATRPPPEEEPGESAGGDQDTEPAAPGDDAGPEEDVAEPEAPEQSPPAGEPVQLAYKVTTNSLNKSYPPSFLDDGDPETPWQEKARTDAVGKSLTFEFDPPATIVKIGVVVGFVKMRGKSDLFPKNNRLKKALLTFPDGEEKEVSFEDLREMQWVDVGRTEPVSQMKLTVVEVYRGVLYDDNAIGEIQIWGVASGT